MYIDEIQTLKMLSKDLTRLKDSLDEFIDTRLKEVLPMTRHHGLASLPNEIILLVFKQLLGLYDDPFVGSRSIIYYLSLVSRRFRENVLAFADAWAHIDLDVCGPELFDLFLHRSGNKPLTVGFGSYREAEDNFRAALTFSDRWEHLYAGFPWYDGRSQPSLSFPTVKHLEIQGHPRIINPVLWKFPNAEYVTLKREIPNSMSYRSESLKSLSYIALFGPMEHSITPVFDKEFLTTLTDFLRPAISLRELHLDVVFSGWSSSAIYNSLKVELPNVKIFSISNWTARDELPLYPTPDSLWGPVVDYMHTLIRSIHLPNVDDFRVALSFKGDVFHSDFLFSDRIKRSTIESATSFTFKIRNKDSGQRLTLDVQEFFHHFPNLRNLALDATELNCELAFPGYLEDELRKLESLEIKARDEMVHVYRILSEMVKRGAPLKKVNIHSPFAFDMKKLREIVPGAQIHTLRISNVPST